MSTRCQTFITFNGKPVATVYRHCDGYPMGMGLDLINMCRKSSTAHELLVKLLTAWDFDAELEEIGAKHGDTEYEYYVDFSGDYSAQPSSPVLTIKSIHTGRSMTAETEGAKWLDAITEIEEFGKQN